MSWVLKCLVIGPPFTGKTSLIKRSVYNIFTANYKATLGVDFAMKNLVYTDQNGQNISCSVALWDVSGNELASNMCRAYYSNSHMAMIVSDFNSENFAEDITQWKNDVDSKVLLYEDTTIPCVILKNKCDLPGAMETYNQQDMDKLAASLGCIGCYPTSAMTGQGIQEAMLALIKHTIGLIKARNAAEEADPEPKEEPIQKIVLESNEPKENKKVEEKTNNANEKKSKKAKRKCSIF